MVASSTIGKLAITSCFDAGNIKVVKIKDYEADLEIVHEPFTVGTDNKAHAQWFYFKAANVLDKACCFRIVNADKASYPEGWPGYEAVFSYDRETWLRTPTSYADGVLTISIESKQDQLWCAYFAPYSFEQHQQLIAQCQLSPIARVHVIGQTLDGRDLDLIQTGTGEIKAWFTGRQHPGETMAEFCLEGLLRRLLDLDDPLARHLRTLCTFHVIPNMNPDGSVRGHLRTNACGSNLNREWCSIDNYEAPTMERSPEVVHTLREMDETGVDFFCDVHGDEEVPHNFFAGSHAMKNWTNRHARLLQTLGESMNRANPDFGSLLYNYGNDQVGGALLNSAGEQIGARFDCLSVTLEQPYKDSVNMHDPETGWSPERCRKLGASLLDALAAVVHDLRRKDMDVDEKSLAEWVKPGYPCPEWTECSWDRSKRIRKQ